MGEGFDPRNNGAASRDRAGAASSGAPSAGSGTLGRTGREHLVVQTAFLGDLLLGIPLFKELRRLQPQDKITLLCRRGLGDLIVRLGLVDEAIEADKSSAESWARAARALRGRRFDMVICPHESFRSLRLVFGLRARLKVGYASLLGRFVFHRRVPRPMGLPEALRQLALLMPVDSVWPERLDTFARTQAAAGGQTVDGLLPVPLWAEMRVDRLAGLRAERAGLSAGAAALVNELDLRAPVAFLAPGSVWKTKMWTSDGYTSVARSLLASGHRVVITGAPDEKAICDEIVFRAPGAVSIAGRTSLFETAELMALGDVLVCNDSGAMHLAAAAGLPTVSIFGPTILDFGYRPWQSSASVVQVGQRAHAELACRPCGTHGAQACPIGTHDCMRRISAERVMTAVREQTALKPGGPDRGGSR